MTDRSDRNRRFSLRLVEVMGLGSLAGLSLAGYACGGNVVVDTATGSGGSGGQGGFSTSTTDVGGLGYGGYPSSTVSGYSDATTAVGTGAGGGLCKPAVPPGETLEETCLAAAECSAVQTPQLISALSKQLGVCDLETSGCCGMPIVEQIACGPLYTPAGTCCYDVIVLGSQPCGGTGRPFTVEGVARVAPARPRADWALAEPSAPATAALDPRTRAALAEAWTREARFEHASIASFARLALELLAVAAPAELVRDAQRAMGDEIRHAELGFALASAYAGAPVGPGPLPFDGALGRVTLAEVAAAAVREGCVGETVAALAAADARDAAEDPAVRAALATIAADEADHAAMAWRLVAWAHRSGDAEVRDAIAAAFGEPAELGSEIAPAGIDERAFRAPGRLRPAEPRACAERALVEVVRPSAAALLGATLRA